MLKTKPIFHIILGMEDSRERLIRLCVSAMGERCGGMPDLRERLKSELKELDNQAEHDYFIDLHDRGVRFPRN